jgi:hypothetical protein
MNRTFIASFLLALAAFSVFAAAQHTTRRWQQFEPEMEDPSEDPPDAWEKTEFAFARLRYRSFFNGFYRRPSWGTDSNKAERQFMRGVRRLSRVHARSVEEIIDVDSDEVFNWPWLYAVEVGHWVLDDSQAKRLRDYLDRGGFLMVDDFHGTQEWAVFTASLRKIFPDRLIVDIPDNDPIFHVLFDLDHRYQVPGAQFLYSGRTFEKDGIRPRWQAIYDDNGRIQVAICHNMDLGDAWEWSDDPRYPENYSALAYRIGLNYVVYSMTH